MAFWNKIIQFLCKCAIPFQNTIQFQWTCIIFYCKERLACTVNLYGCLEKRWCFSGIVYLQLKRRSFSIQLLNQISKKRLGLNVGVQHVRKRKLEIHQHVQLYVTPQQSIQPNMHPVNTHPEQILQSFVSSFTRCCCREHFGSVAWLGYRSSSFPRPCFRIESKGLPTVTWQSSLCGTWLSDGLSSSALNS